MTGSRDTALDVVIVTYNSNDLIRICLESLFLHAPGLPMRVFVADNNSPDDTATTVEQCYPDVTVVRRRSNDGFAVANNDLISRTTARYILVLNPDTKIEPGTLDRLVAEMEDDPTIGMLGCRLLTESGALDHAAKRSFPSPISAAKYFALRTVGKVGSAYVRPDVADDSVADVDAINGAFMLIRRDALNEVGGLDERYWMYGEDLDWCARFAETGWRVVYDGRVVAHHLKAGSTGGERPPRLNYHFHRSMVIFYRDHTSKGNLLVDALVLSAIWTRFALTTLLSSAKSAARAPFRARRSPAIAVAGEHE